MDGTMLTKADLIEAVRARMGFSRKTSAEVVSDLFEIIKARLENGESVKISGFGNFEVNDKKSRRGRNPRTGEEMTISARRVVTFKPSQVLRKAINSRS